ncbi:MAG: tetratricopeptide repeat protein, partial [Acidobacteriota bacterium]|nr:tetratricopeptide repeat protein [Acidobacteriota bacterium]
MRLAAALAALALLGWSLPAAGDPPEEAPGPASCPADGIRALGAPAARWLDRARQEGAGNPGCARKATLALQLLDADRPVDCGALDIAPGSSLTAADPDVSSLTAALAWRCGRPRAAHHAARAALAVDPDATLAWRVLGKVLAARFRPDAALAAYERAVALDPRDAQSLWGLAGLRHDRARRKETLRRFLEVAEARGETKE